MYRADEGLAFLLRYENIAWYEDGAVRILDRRIYPIRIESVVCHRHEEVAKAIFDMVTQSGGPYTAASMGMALAAYEARELPDDEYRDYMEKAAYNLSHARPTTVERMKRVVERALGVLDKALEEGVSRQDIPERLRNDAIARLNENYTRYDRIAAHLADMIPMNGTVMTQCFAETIIGTLLRECRKRGSAVKMICPETRPYYQGARLTAISMPSSRMASPLGLTSVWMSLSTPRSTGMKCTAPSFTWAMQGPSSRSTTAEAGTTHTSFASARVSSALAVIPAMSREFLSVMRMVAGITRSVDLPPFSSPVGEMAVTSPRTVSPFRMSALISASWPTATWPMEYSLTSTSISRASRFSMVNSGSIPSPVSSANRPTLVLTRTTVPAMGLVITVSSRASCLFSTS